MWIEEGLKIGLLYEALEFSRYGKEEWNRAGYWDWTDKNLG